ncbi:MAG: hypothetical protein PHP08_00065 [Candidatus Dojkabacteria bacterium]|nr:hypothetical protein [Candidatus Dojkabacteria bacterium]
MNRENREFTKTLVKIEDLPEDIQHELMKRYEIQQRIEQYKIQIEDAKELQRQNQGTNIIINNNNRYYITNNTRVLRNDGTINEKQDSVLDIFAKAAGRAAGKAWAKLNEESK